jgi:hypothetical protein
MEHEELKSISGKLIDIRLLVRGGKFNLVFFLKAANQERGSVVRPSEQLREQAKWWMVTLARSNCGGPILHPDQRVPSGAVEGWTDAAGGSLRSAGAGLGGLVPPFRAFYQPWPAWLNGGGSNSDGVRFDSKLTCLELLGPLALLVSCADVVAGGHLRVFVDNQGAVDIYKKGHSTKCLYSASIAKAIYEVAEAIGATVSVEKIRRCSDRGSYTADMLSKGNLAEGRRMLPLREPMREVPYSLVRWLKDPRVDMSWSKEILKDLESMGVEVI